MPTLVIVCGLPGSGKTTAARALAASRDAFRFNADEWMTALGISLWDADARDRIERLQWGHALDLLRLGVSVVIEWGTWSRHEREQLAAQARESGARVAMCALDAPDADLFARIQRRGMEDPPIQEADIALWRSLFEPPVADELDGYDEVITAY